MVGLLTVASRVLGLGRDVAMAAVFGSGPVMDAFSVAFRVPNLARRLFGEGALTAAFLPVFVREMERAGRESAWRLASAVLAGVTVLLGGLTLAGELALWGAAWYWSGHAETQLLIGLTAVMLPYMVLICVASQLSAILHALGHFTGPALLPILLNVVWMAALLAAVGWVDSPVGQVYLVAVGIVAAGMGQLAAPLPLLHRLGFRFRRNWQSVAPHVREIGRAMLPVVLGLSIHQINTLADGLIAWGLSAPAAEECGMRNAECGMEDEKRVSFHSALRTPHSAFPHPLPAGTASALYFGQRLYQFPLGVFGVALGTVIFPLLARHAGRREWDRLRDDLTLGLRLVVAIGVPASVGLWLLARPLTALFFQHGAFTADDAARTAAIVGAYGLGVWAYCGQLILHRAFYAVGDRLTPLRIGLWAVLLNLALNLLLIWPLAGEGLALATSLSAAVQVALLGWTWQRRVGCVDWRRLAATTLRTLIASLAMAAACLAVLHQFAAGPQLWHRAILVAAPLTAAVAAFLAAARLVGLDEVRLLLRRSRPDAA